MIAPIKGEGFADIFEGNAYGNGLLPLDATKANDMLTNFSNLRADSFVDAQGVGEETTVTATFGEEKASSTESVTFRVVPGKKKGDEPTVHAMRKGEKGALVISALEFDKAMAIFKELTGSK